MNPQMFREYDIRGIAGKDHGGKPSAGKSEILWKKP